MAGEHHHHASRALVVPVGVTITAVWAAIGLSTIWTGDVQSFAIATGPFGLFVGGIFGVGIIRRAENQ